MCIAYIRFQPKEDAALFIAANRDEFHARPTAFAGIWEDSQDIIAGRDLEAGGTWLGTNRQGGAALITNIRDPLTMRSDAKSRGALVHNALLHQAYQNQHWFESTAINRFLEEQGPLRDYNGFNLIFGDTKKLYYLNNYQALKQALHDKNHQDKLLELSPGSYTLSNADLYTVWPKTKQLGSKLDAINLRDISSSDFETLDSNTVLEFTNNIFKKLADNEQAPDHLLPNTGVSDGFEKLLSSPFIISPEYGTRCSSIILNFNDGSSFMAERSFDPQGQAIHQVFYYQKNGLILSQ